MNKLIIGFVMVALSGGAFADKIRVSKASSGYDVKALLDHPMETGLRKDKDSKLIPAKYIEQVEILKNGEVVYKMEVGASVSKNPFFQLNLTQVSKGDVIAVKWIDNTGAGNMTETTYSE